MVTLWKIFWIFAKIGAFTIGGGIPMIVAIKKELVERQWLNDEDFIDICSLWHRCDLLFCCVLLFLFLYIL
jgi:chromate transporter